jgi:hypothetical protein
MAELVEIQTQSSAPTPSGEADVFSERAPSNRFCAKSQQNSRNRLHWTLLTSTQALYVYAYGNSHQLYHGIDSSVLVRRTTSPIDRSFSARQSLWPARDRKREFGSRSLIGGSPQTSLMGLDN